MRASQMFKFVVPREARCGEVVWSWGAIVVLWSQSGFGVSPNGGTGVVSPMNNYRAPCSLRES